MIFKKRYEKISRLGEGSFGEVLKVLDKKMANFMH